MTIAEKYPELKGKSIKDMVLEIVTNIANNWKSDEGLEIVCGWWETESKPKANDSQWFDFMAGECYHDEINDLMKEQGFRVYEDFGGFRHRARTTYRLEY